MESNTGGIVMEQSKKTTQRLVVVIMGQNCERFIEMCLESVKDADEIVYCDGGSIDGTLDIVNGFITKEINTGKPMPEGTLWYAKHPIVIENKYNQEDLGMNGKQRNFYLNYLKSNYPGWYCLVLDADEVLEEGGIQKIKEFLDKNGE